MMKATLILVLTFTAAIAVFPRTISADLRSVKGPTDRFYNLAVGAGRAAEILRADVQRDLRVVREECGFRYLRFHGLLHDELGVYREDGKGNAVYNFQYIDQIYDAILATGMKPFVEFGFMPDALRSNDKTIFWWRGNVAPPKDYAKWEKLIEALVRHWTMRYGQREVESWFFEVWNEPNLDAFFSGTQAEYFKLYETTVRAVKRVSPNYRVGGPATAGRGWITETIDFAAQNNVAIDFISTHDYGVSGIGLDEFGTQKLSLDRSPGAIVDGVREVRGKIKESRRPNLPLHYTEWSTSYSQVDPVHDSYVSAAYIVSRLKGIQGYAESMSYWTFTDNFEEGGPVKTPFHGGFGLINFQGLRKPSFYAYQFLNELGDVEISQSDPNSFVTKSKGEVQVLFWNYSPPETAESNQVFYKRDIPAKPAGRVDLNLEGLENGEYEMSVFQVGHRVNDVYAEYLAIGAPQSLTREQVTELARRTDGRARATENHRVRGGKLAKSFEIRENDVYLVKLRRR